ncbi:lipoxygenase family protein [Cystobacter ferrugineus]|uniref:Lipoxygenase domain-containing protein n=1 Tax=Cystobacter ferrugineus TaxID=83449 RepID=A0A1L9B5V1_9BACT|nr:lipoxygenase family protein [Cystobacter ferrugineus]OJH37603.1 hypothetical protein BON30_25740 [Cystobacter ferrugineus]
MAIVEARSSSPASEYTYNYEYVSPLAMSQSVPKSEQPTLEWYGQVVWQSLRIGHNLLQWKIEQAQREQASNPSAPAPAPDAMSVDLSSRGLGKIDLTHLAKFPTPDSLKAGLSELGETARFAEQCALITERAWKQELGSVTDILKLVVDAVLAKPVGRPHSLQDYTNLFTTLPLPQPVQAGIAEKDETFAWMRVAGFNPLVIRKALTPEDTLGLSDAQLSAVLGAGDTVRQALAEGRLFLADYKALAGVINGNFPDGPKYCFAPRALFGLPRGSGPRQLEALGIRCGQDSSAYVLYTPADGVAWDQAKTVVEVADFNLHELSSHLGRTHLLVEPFVVATHQCLPDSHPVSLLLRPHFEGTIFINNAAQAKLIAPGGDVDMLLGGTIATSRVVAVQSLLDDPSFDFNQGMLPNELENRGVTDASLDYPYRDDAQLLWGAIEQWVRSYVVIHYASDAQVANDQELQLWSRTLVSKDGGRVRGFGEDGAGKLTTVDYLVKALTMLIFTGSAQHAAVNFAQAGLMTYTPFVPGAAYRGAPFTSADAALNPPLDQLPPLDMASTQLNFLTLLGSVYHTQLGQYPALWFKELRVVEPLREFQTQLERISTTIQERNKGRYAPYPYLDPKKIPQSINI